MNKYDLIETYKIWLSRIKKSNLLKPEM